MPIIDLSIYSIHCRIFQVGTRVFTDGQVGGFDSTGMTYPDFVFFMLSEEDKSSEMALRYWYVCYNTFFFFSYPFLQFRCFNIYVVILPGGCYDVLTWIRSVCLSVGRTTYLPEIGLAAAIWTETRPWVQKKCGTFIVIKWGVSPAWYVYIAVLTWMHFCEWVTAFECIYIFEFKKWVSNAVDMWCRGCLLGPGFDQFSWRIMSNAWHDKSCEPQSYNNRRHDKAR